MKQKYTPVAIILASILGTLLAAASFGKLASLLSLDTLMEPLPEEPAIEDAGEFAIPEFDEINADDPAEALFEDFFEDDVKTSEIQTPENAAPEPQPSPSTSSPSPSPSPSPASPVFYRNGKIVEVAAPENKAEEDEPYESAQEETAQTEAELSSAGSGAITQQETDEENHPAPEEAQITGKPAAEKTADGNFGGISTLMIISSAGTVLLLSLVIALAVMMKKKKTPAPSGQNAYETKPAPVFAENSSVRLDGALTAMGTAQGNTQTGEKPAGEDFPTKYLDHDAVLPVTHPPQEPVKDVVGSDNPNPEPSQMPQQNV